MRKTIFTLVILIFISCSKDDNEIITNEVTNQVLSGVIANDQFVAKGGKAFKSKGMDDQDILSVYITNSSKADCASSSYDYEYSVSVDILLKEGKSDYNQANVVLSKKGRFAPRNILQSLIIVKKLTKNSITIAIKAGNPSDKAFMGEKDYIEGVFTVPICE